mmetsp:Transcript_3482/g.13468  ORF Transcript_3482/g.13468 Transcript_3482/m.13468 type:complete len:419 (-) Transcript_3482:371-1627(-)
MGRPLHTSRHHSPYNKCPQTITRASRRRPLIISVLGVVVHRVGPLLPERALRVARRLIGVFAGHHHALHVLAEGFLRESSLAVFGRRRRRRRCRFVVPRRRSGGQGGGGVALRRQVGAHEFAAVVAVVLARAHRFDVFGLVLADVLKHVEQRVARRASCAGRRRHLEIVEIVQIVGRVVRPRDRRRRERLESLAVLSDEGAVRVDCVGFEELHELIREARREKVDPDQEPVIRHGDVVAEESVGPPRVAAEGLHDQQVVELVVLFGAVHLAQLGRAPPAEGFVEVEHRDVREVRDARDGFEKPKPRDGPFVEEVVQESAADVVERARHGVRLDLLSFGFPRPFGRRDGLVGERDVEDFGRSERVSSEDAERLAELDEQRGTLAREVAHGELRGRRLQSLVSRPDDGVPWGSSSSGTCI